MASRVGVGVAGRVGQGCWNEVAGLVGRKVGWCNWCGLLPVAQTFHTALKGVCNGGVKNTLRTG